MFHVVIKSLRSTYQRFRQWQLDPFIYKVNRQESHHCINCGNEFVGNFCPVCSQREGMGRITWKSVVRSIGEVWGLHNRSLLYSIVQLFLRPGYFISDYISGKRQVSFPPVKMLAIISLLGIFVDYITGARFVGVFNYDFDFKGDKMFFLDNAFEWINTHPDLMSLIILSYLIIPIYYIFRFSPRNSHHTLPQGFFIQVFSSVLFLILNMIYDITAMRWFVFVWGIVMHFAIYKQLFGYGIWGTLWRFISAVVCALLIAVILLLIDYSVHMFNNGDSDTASVILRYALPVVVAFVAIIWISYRIGKRHATSHATTTES